MLLAQIPEVAKAVEYAGQHWGFAAWVVAVLLFAIGFGLRTYFYQILKPASEARVAHDERLVKCMETVTVDVALIKTHCEEAKETSQRIERTLSEKLQPAG